jgi:hypothetical protein
MHTPHLLTPPGLVTLSHLNVSIPGSIPGHLNGSIHLNMNLRS